jgi:mRNA interferase YafQ
VFRIRATNRFEKDFIRCINRKLNIDDLGEVLEILEKSGKLPLSYKPHLLLGRLRGYWECHIGPDWLLIWKQDNKTKVIELVRTGSHSDLFKK